MGVSNFTDIANSTGTIKIGTYTAVAADDTAGTKSIDTGLSSITAYVVQIFRAGVPIFSDQAISVSGGSVVVADGGATYALTANDVINYVVIGS